MILEREIDYYKSKFMKIDSEHYIRQIKKHWFSDWKIAANPATNEIYLYSENDINLFWKGKAIEIISFSTDDDLLKWTNYILI